MFEGKVAAVAGEVGEMGEAVFGEVVDGPNCGEGVLGSGSEAGPGEGAGEVVGDTGGQVGER